MRVFQPDPAFGRPIPRDLPAFQVVRRGYDPAQVDAFLPQFIARLEDAGRASALLQCEVIDL
jgi:DivIVA domain-containing protein